MIHANQGVWDISLETQPAKSPDTNVLDLSFSGHCNQSNGAWVQRLQLMD
jgi:hypothetical protein